MKNKNPGLIHIYKGEGKGKTSAATGLAVRALGRGKKVVFLQFLKGNESGEINTLSKLDGLIMVRNTIDFDFVFKLSDDEKKKLKDMQNHNLKEVIQLVNTGDIDMLVIDELFPAYNLDTIDKELVRNLVLSKPESMELVLTGHEPDEFFITHADYITHMTKERHPYDKGVAARIGIEM